MNNTTFIALVGHPRSGKSTLARILKEDHRFTIISGSELLRNSVVALPKDRRESTKLVTREDYDSYHKLWRMEQGLDAMAVHAIKLYENLPHPKRLCFENIRNKYDAETIQKAGGLIVAVECPIELRLDRAKSVSSQKDNLDEGAFKKAEEAEYTSTDPYGSHVAHIMARADVTLDGSAPLETVYDEFLSKVMFKILI